jgi:carboxymethylenebutenolidase
VKKKKIEAIVEEYKGGALDRRAFISRLVAVTGSMGAAHLWLESTGLAETLVSARESRASKVSSETIKYPSAGGTSVSGYLSAPEAGGKFPAVVVIHENRGLNDHTRDVARRFAAEGFVALAPDLISRKGGTGAMESPDKAREALAAIPAADALTDLKAGLAFLNKHAKVKNGRLGSVGFCWGGARSFLLAAESELLRAAVVFYGSAPPPEKLAEVRVPVLGLYGERDERITSQVPVVAETLQKSSKRFEHKIYAGAGHAFFNDTGERYHAEAAKDAWTRALAFLRENLK